MWKDFKAFALKGNMLDLAVGIILGAAFGRVVTSLVGDLLMPPLGRLTGNVDFKDLFVDLSGKSFPSLAAAKAAGAPTVNYGVFMNTVIDFFIVAFAVFLLVKWFHKLTAADKAITPPPAPPTKEEQLLTEIRDLLKQRA